MGRLIFTFIAIGIIAVACSTLAPRRGPAGDGSSIHVIATTDLHGYILPQKNADGSAIGGIDVMSGLFQIARAADPETLLLDSGDLFQGTIISNTTEGSTVVTWMNYANYVAAAIGNHDFDFGPGNGDSQVRKPGEDPLGALKARIAQANFKFLGANICSLDEDACTDVNSFKGANFALPYMIKDVHGVKLGILGLTTPSTPQTTFPGNVARLKFFPLKETIERFVPEMAERGAQSIIVLMHEGILCANGKCDPNDAFFKIIDGLSSNVRKMIPLVLAGHTHNQVNVEHNGVRMMIDGSYGHTFGYVTLDQQADGSLKASAADSVPMTTAQAFLGATVKPDANAFKLIDADIRRANEKSAEVVGELASSLQMLPNQAESTLGDFVADALRLCTDSACTADRATDIAFINSTGIRTKTLLMGSVTYGQIFQMMPFDNFLAIVKMTGRQVHDLIDCWYNYNHGNFDESSGIHITYAAASTKMRTMTNLAGVTQTIPDPIVSISMADGSAFDEDRVYSVAMADFLAEGGSGSGFVLKNFSPAPAIHMDRQIRDMLVDYLRAHKVDPLDYSKIGGKRVEAQ
jgi:5'-nucleotidase